MSDTRYWCDMCGENIGEPCECKGTGSVDSGGVTPWGESIEVPCECVSLRKANDEQRETIKDRDVRAIMVALIELSRHTTGKTWVDLITHAEDIAHEMEKQRNKRKGIEK